MTGKFAIAWGRLAFLGLSAAASVTAGYVCQPLISDNKEAINTIVTIFSILAGFLIAIITFIAEPTISKAQNWQQLQKLKPLVERKMIRQKLLFYLYLSTLGLALTMFLIPPEEDALLVWFERAFLSLAVFIFIMSFTLPSALMRIQMDRYDALLDKEAPAGLKKDAPPH